MPATVHYYALRGEKTAVLTHSPSLLQGTGHELGGGGKLLDLRNPSAGSHFGFKEHFAPCRAVLSIIGSNNLYKFIITNQQYSERLCQRFLKV